MKRTLLFHPNLYSTSYTTQRARHGAERGIATPARATTLHAWRIASVAARRAIQRSGALLTQSVAPLGAPPTE